MIGVTAPVFIIGIAHARSPTGGGKERYMLLRKLFKLLFSRYMISALIILLDIAALAYLIVSFSAYSVVFLVEVLTVNLMVLIAIMNADYNPEYRVSWIAVVLMFPVVGALLYVLFHRHGMREKDRQRATESMEKMLELDTHDVPLDSLSEIDELAAGKATAITRCDPAALLYTGASVYYPSGEELYADMLRALGSAEKFIFLEYFIIDEGAMWGGILDILKEKAAAGVEVRVMFDDIGCMGKLPGGYERTLRSYGIAAQRFSPASPRVSAVHNNRDHRKICIVDGVVAFTGGANIADEYINAEERFGHWKDGGVSLRGEAVNGLTRLFISLWDMTSGSASDFEKYITKCQEKVTDHGYYMPFGSGPGPLYPGKSGKRVFEDLINQARRYVYITTPYLIVDFDLTSSLIGAAERGVDVRIITPAKADKRLVKVMTKSSYAQLIAAGVKIYEYTPGFIHEKLVVSDDVYAVIGTINFDYRSLVHHFEDAVWICGSPTVAAARDGFLDTLSRSAEISEEEARLKLHEWVVKCLLRIFAPLL